MNLLDLTLPTPAENLACDEALLDWCEAGGNEEVLRLWESPTPFVVVGYANKVTSEVNVAACEARGVPILRRCSGGGTVVQGPGCLSYALVLQITEDGPTRSISAANRFIMERNRAAIESAIGNRQSAIRVQGHTDLTIDGLKFSGNSPDRCFAECVEIPGHPWFFGCQFHPEFKSKPFQPHPLFASFVAAAWQKKLSRTVAQAPVLQREMNQD